MWFHLGMCRQRNMPNRENCTLVELETAAKDQLIDRLTEALMWLINRQDENVKTYVIPTEL